LPDLNARKDMFKLYLGKMTNTLTESDFEELAQKSEGYSGADINIIVRDALMSPIRCLVTATHFKKVRGISKITNTIIDDLLTPCSSSDPGAIKIKWIDAKEELLEHPITKVRFS
jgi:vacuolar protein-sorting-associated protein 4